MTTFPTRLVLEGVPRIHFYDGGARCPEDIILPSVMRALMEYFNEETLGCRVCRGIQPACRVPCSYAFFVGVTGAASFLSWKKGWEGDNVALFYMSADPAAPSRRAFEAAGYTYEVVEKRTGSERELFCQRLFESLQKGYPVCADGVIGPPETCLITGYDEGGEVLIGWNFFQQFPEFNAGVTFEPPGYFRKRNWFEDTHDFLILTGKRQPPPLKEIYRSALEWMLTVARTPVVRPEPDAPEWYQQRANGLAAYDAWADQLLQDDDFPDGETAILQQRHQVHDNVVGTVAEARWYGSQFLTGMTIGGDDIVHRNALEDLYHAAALYAGDHALMWDLWALAGGNGSPEGWKLFADPAVRRQMIPIIQKARDNDARAADHLERVLARWPGD